MNRIVNSSEMGRALSLVTSLVASTAGPYGSNVRFFNGETPITFRDGLKVLENYMPIGDDLVYDQVKRLLQRAYLVRRAAGDGTTTMTILTNAFYRASLGRGGSPRQRGAFIRRFGDEMVSALRRMAIQIEEGPAGVDLLSKVATIAAGNNPVIGELVAKAVMRVGVNGSLQREFDKQGSALRIEEVEGFIVKGGALNEGFIEDRGKTVLEEPYVVCVSDVSEWSALRTIMEVWHRNLVREDGRVRPLLLVARNIEGSARDTLVRRMSADGKKIPVYVVKAESDDVLADVVAVSGGENLVKRSGGMIANFKNVDHFGHAKRAVIDMGRLVLVGSDAERIPARRKELEARLEVESDDSIREGLKARIAALEGKVGIIHIPMTTTGETNWLSEVVEDAQMAAFAALKEGVVPGAGISLCEAGEAAMHSLGKSDVDFAQSLYVAAKAVSHTLLFNGGVSLEVTEKAINIARGQGKGWTIMLDDGTLDALLRGSSEGLRIGPAVDLGVLDSVVAVCAAVREAAAEAAEAIETSFIVLPNNV